MSAQPVLVADIGATNARFALARRSGPGGGWTIGERRTLRAADFETVRDAAAAYLNAATVRPRIACFAVAGPAHGDVVAFSNSPWTLDKALTRRLFGLEVLTVVNDFAALAAGCRVLPEGSCVEVKPGEADPGAPRLVLGPGSGFGQALLVPSGAECRVVPTEGGHVGFAPQTEEEIEIMRFVAREHPRVSVERLLSGPGLVVLHRALSAAAGAQKMSPQASEITAAASSGADPVCVKTVEVFCALLGAAAGDAALAAGARGGVVLGGGILPQIRDALLAGRFVERFLDKGRMRTYLKQTPVDLLVADETALLGAASLVDDPAG